MAAFHSRRLGTWAMIAAVLAFAAACGSGDVPAAAVGVRGTDTSMSVPATTTTAAATPEPTTTVPRAPKAATTPRPTSALPTPTPTTAVVPPELGRAGTAGQAIVVTAAPGAPAATLTTWRRAGDGWVRAHGPWPARIGRAGFAPPGAKREGDGRTPSGTFAFQFAFGVLANPGVALPYRQVTGPSIVWVDDPASPSYNQWVDTAVQNPGGHGEAMFQTPAYDYGAVIAYNTARTPGLGSAIFLHVSTGEPTAGCVSLPADRLVDVLRWLDPALAPVIVMGST